MTLAWQEKITGTFSLQPSKTSLDVGRSWAKMRLSAVYEAAQEIPFDDTSRLILLSDCHRGDNGAADNFAGNEDLFLHALSHYFRAGYTYIEIGDGDEMWKNKRYNDILRAHPHTFDLLHRFHRHDRLHLIFGNHDTQGYGHTNVCKDGLRASEGLILRHSKSGQRLFLVHGHQADFKSDRLRVLGRFVVRHIWRPLQLLGFDAAIGQVAALQRRSMPLSHRGRDGQPHPPGGGRERQIWISKIAHAKKLCEKRIMSWADARRQVVICGHTHRPLAPTCGGPLYFNTGSCVVPGALTGLEIRGGRIALVRWIAPSATRNGEAGRFDRQVIAPPRELCQLP